MKSKISELDNAKVIKYWNDTNLTNAQVAKKLDAPWGLVATKAKRVNSVKDQLTVERTGGASGTVEAVAPAPKTKRVVAASSAVNTDSSGGRISVKVVIKSSDNTDIASDDLSGNLETVVTAMKQMMSDNRITKADLYRNGSMISIPEICDGDVLVVRPAIFGA
jgi:DNA polymerase II large subunit